MVADISVDMFQPIVPLKVLRVLGLGESDLGDRARHRAAAQPLVDVANSDQRPAWKADSFFRRFAD